MSAAIRGLSMQIARLLGCMKCHNRATSCQSEYNTRGQQARGSEHQYWLRKVFVPLQQHEYPSMDIKPRNLRASSWICSTESAQGSNVILRRSADAEHELLSYPSPGIWMSLALIKNMPESASIYPSRASLWRGCVYGSPTAWSGQPNRRE